MQTLGNEEVNKRAKSAKKVLPNLLNYFEQTIKSIEECQKEGVSKDVLEGATLKSTNFIQLIYPKTAPNDH